MRYIAFKRHRILISFDVVISGKKKSRRRESGEVKSIVVVIDHILSKGYQPLSNIIPVLREMRNYFLLIKSFVNITEYPLSLYGKRCETGT
ncbi:hypothetical protein EMO49_08475 [Escherichia coli]|nr:hypothetical protein [Escherichia coli]EEX2879717.1 hypothetical protein [Escherichia coli]